MTDTEKYTCLPGQKIPLYSIVLIVFQIKVPYRKTVPRLFIHTSKANQITLSKILKS